MSSISFTYIRDGDILTSYITKKKSLVLTEYDLNIGLTLLNF